ncbi:MAG: FAD-dependent oxidoreductase, partial [Planctomycetaceae bacterium]|nr:FAD-dependent oxidoreductase [Planctomycetaceae bacterium]
VFPVYRGSAWKFWQLRIGVRIYDWLCGHGNLGRSGSLSAAQAAHLCPGLSVSGLVGATRHFDAFTNDARLVIDMLLSARQAGAEVFNYLGVTDVQQTDAGWSCHLADELTTSSCQVQARCVINATGPWADRPAPSSVRLRLTKGVHIVIERSRLPVTEAVVLSKGKRILFVIPWAERVILGTTDTDFVGDPGDVRTDTADIGYILDVVNSFFPDADLSPSDVVSHWAGVRPLVSDRATQRNAPSEMSRGHLIRMPAPGWFDVAGGKLTTARLMAEQTIQQIARYRGVKRRIVSSASVPLVQGAGSGSDPAPPTRDLVSAFCRSEWAVHLDDVLLRRTGWSSYFGADHEIVQQTAEWMSAEMGWSPDEAAAELRRFQVIAAR